MANYAFPILGAQDLFPTVDVEHKIQETIASLNQKSLSNLTQRNLYIDNFKNRKYHVLPYPLLDIHLEMVLSTSKSGYI